MIFLYPLVPILLGALTMVAVGLPVERWALNPVAFIAMALVCRPAGRAGTSLTRDHPGILVTLAVTGMSLSLACGGVGDVHRWLWFGPLTLHASFVLLPLAVIGLEGLDRAGRPRLGLAAAVWLMAVLLAQPDASQSTALAASMIVLSLGSGERRLSRWFSASLFAALSAVSWLRPDGLAGVPSVEGIVGLAGGLGPWAPGLAVVALAGVPATLLLAGRSAQAVASATACRALAAYYAGSLLSAAYGEFPVAFMGFGISPLLGYCLAVSLLDDRPPEP